jgi:Icc-related predicted phosphoesterase
MNFDRRKFLILSGLALSGTTLAVFGRPKPPAPPTVKAETKKVNVGPAGLFAPERGDVRIVVISDLNSQYGSTEYGAEVDKGIELIPAWQPDIVLCGGDMIAGQSPKLSEAQIKAMWAAFDRHIASPLRQAGLPYGFTIGNHDASGSLNVKKEFVFNNERELASAYWNDPQHDPKLQFVDRANFPFYYTFQQDRIFYLVWDASTSIIPAEQLVWVEESLASAAAQDARLRIVIGHLPLYGVAVGRNKQGEILSNGDKLRSLLEKYNVRTYISGHQHAYYPGHRGKLQLLNCGALGDGPRSWVGSQLAPVRTLTVVDVNLDRADTIYTTYDMTTLQVFDYRKLPRSIVSPNGMILRRDVEEADLTQEERSRQ